MDSLILFLLLVTLVVISSYGLKLMDNIDLCDVLKKFKSILSKISNINIEAIRSYIKSKRKKIGAALILICLSIGYALTLGNVISIKPSLENCNKACNVSVKNCIKTCDAPVKNCIKTCDAPVKNCIEDCNASLKNCLEDCETSIKINYKALFIYTVLSFYAFAFAGLFFKELSKHEDL